MSRQWVLDQAARLHREAMLRYADQVPVNLADSHPHDGQRSDYNEHHADVSAPPELEDSLNQALVDLVTQWRNEPAGGRGPTLSKVEANYRPAAGSERCGNCSMFRGDYCTLVEGVIDPAHICDHWAMVKLDEGVAGDVRARNLIKWFNRGADGQIAWGTPGDFDECVRIAGGHMAPGKAKGFCANRHHDATGEWPGPHAHEKADSPTLAQKIRRQLTEDYPLAAMRWLDDAQITGPFEVEASKIDFDDVESWQASDDPEKVARFRERLERGKAKPVLLVDKPGEGKLMVADGHHRALAGREADLPVPAWIAKVPTQDGPWDQMHSLQYRGHRADLAEAPVSAPPANGG